jgi:predicted ATPase
LIREFEEVYEGKNKLIFIAGYSGIGKTSLVREIHRPIALRRGFFISGKFDQFQKDMPYYALAEALRELVQYFLMGSDEQVQSWKIKLLNALGPNAQIVIDLIPELELLLDHSHPYPYLVLQKLRIVSTWFFKILSKSFVNLSILWSFFWMTCNGPTQHL